MVLPPMSVALRVVFVLLIPQRCHGSFLLVSMFSFGLYLPSQARPIPALGLNRSVHYSLPPLRTPYLPPNPWSGVQVDASHDPCL